MFAIIVQILILLLLNDNSNSNKNNKYVFYMESRTQKYFALLDYSNTNLLNYTNHQSIHQIIQMN